MTESNEPIVTTKNSDWAVISLIAGISGFTLLPVLGSVIALVAGYAAKSDIRRSMGRLVGEGMATWGLVLGWIGLGLLLIGICLGLVIPLATGAALCGGLPELLEQFGIIY